MVLLVPLIATDFRSIWPDIPLRFGAVGALVVLFFAFGPGRNTSRERILALLIFLAIAGIFAYGYFSTGAGDDAGRAIRALAVGLVRIDLRGAVLRGARRALRAQASRPIRCLPPTRASSSPTR